MGVMFDRAQLENDGAVWLKLKVMPDSLVEARRFVFEMQEKTYVAELKQYRQKRSLNANAYCWELCDKIAKAVRSTKEEVYLLAIKAVGSFVEIRVQEKDAKSARDCWEHNGLGWLTEDMGTIKGYTTIHAYKGSSVYDTLEMSGLIDWLVEEAKRQAIDVRTPDEIASMKALWDEAQ